MEQKIIDILYKNEIMVLAGMIRLPQRKYELLNFLTKDHFLTELNKNIFEIIEQNKELSDFELLNKIEQTSVRMDYDMGKVNNFIEFTELEGLFCDGDKIIEEIQTHKRYRDIKKKFNDINPYEPTNDDIDKLIETVSSNKKNEITYTTQKDCFIQLFSDYQKQKNLKAIKTGFESYDDFVGGFVGGLHLLAGRPGAGKTSYAMQLGLNCAQSNDDILVLFFSMEVNLQSISQKIVSTTANISLHKIKNYSINKEDFKKFDPVYNVLKENMIFIETNSISVAEIEHHKKFFEKKYNKKVGLIITDYLQIMKPSDRKYNNETERVQLISSELRELGKDVPVLALAQLNREGRDEDCPEPRNLKGSSQIEQDASTIIMLWRKDPMKQNEISCGIVKNRFGEAFRFVEYDFDGSLSRFTPKGEPLSSTDFFNFNQNNELDPMDF